MQPARGHEPPSTFTAKRRQHSQSKPRPVGSKEVQTFNGTARPEHGADLALIIGLNGSTQPAIDFAQRHNLTLIAASRWASTS
ncbi:restriction endonuclease [Streptomyces coeruleorubidus]|uniref:restriction endonuclease n=1 Tax=Streptomyces coeruleorubidus TaxID=116188 RepID=UPI00237F471C|nr:restriction endonuclease [Streptomyces coeruleorubidus]WDV57063.1 restriction endonuclease [Streptomyces coeruleorubidus]